MGKVISGRPETGEYGEYFGKYVSLVDADDLVAALQVQSQESLRVFGQITEEMARLPYAAGKWTFKEALGHLTDSERVFTYRALRFARNDATELPGFDQDAFMQASNFRERSWAHLLAEHEAVRRASLLLFEGFDAAAWQRQGVASGCRMSVRALGFCVAGHELHHLRILQAGAPWFELTHDGRPPQATVETRQK